VLSQRLLLELRRCWKHYRPATYLFEGKRPGQPLDATSVQRAFRLACQKAGIAKPRPVTAAETLPLVGRHALQ
jgi:integrase/recombinase XerD